MHRMKKIDDFGISLTLGEWAPKYVEAGADAQVVLALDPDLDAAAQDAVVLLLGELAACKTLHSRSFQATLTQRAGGRNTYWIVLLVTNGNPDIPKSRVLILSPRELKANTTLWEIIGTKSQEVIDSMIAAATPEGN